MVDVFCPAATYKIPEINRGKNNRTGQRGRPNLVKKIGKKMTKAK
jgi:hypothetical protein